LKGGFKGVRRREWSKNEIKIFNKKKFFRRVYFFRGHVTGTTPFFRPYLRSPYQQNFFAHINSQFFKNFQSIPTIK
jgi:hypothetical protein